MALKHAHRRPVPAWLTSLESPTVDALEQVQFPLTDVLDRFGRF